MTANEEREHDVWLDSEAIRLAAQHRPSWDEFYLTMTDAIALRSKDMSTKVGAVIVKDRAILSMGYNGMPRGVDDSVLDRHRRPMKYLWTDHAERNAIYNAARLGVSTLGATMYTQGPPCAPCASAVIQAGIVRFVTRTEQVRTNAPDSWAVTCAVGRTMLDEAGVWVGIADGSKKGEAMGLSGNIAVVGSDG